MNVLAVRFSAIGDVALLVPAFKKALALNPGLKITFVSKPFFEPLFKGIDGLRFIGINLNQYAGISGLFRLSATLLQENKEGIFLDLHDSLRTRVMRSIWQFRGRRVFVLHKARHEKAMLTRRRARQLRPLKHAADRYLDVFKAAGLINEPVETALPVLADSGRINWLGGQLASDLPPYPQHGRKEFQFGYAPFAGFELKELPPERKLELLKLLLKTYPLATVILFGGKENYTELQLLSNSTGADDFSSRVTLAADMVRSFEEELKLIQQLDLMLSMDSGNLHLAAISGVKVVGIYGTTHPYLGFSPYGQEESGTVGLAGLECRPCTVYGKGKCYRGDFACMVNLPLQKVVDKITFKLEN